MGPWKDFWCNKIGGGLFPHQRADSRQPGAAPGGTSGTTIKTVNRQLILHLPNNVRNAIFYYGTYGKRLYRIKKIQ
jgi:hypothetical protein